MNGIKTGFFETAEQDLAGMSVLYLQPGFPVDLEKEENS
jgi:hypothetical protein